MNVKLILTSNQTILLNRDDIETYEIKYERQYILRPFNRLENEIVVKKIKPIIDAIGKEVTLFIKNDEEEIIKRAILSHFAIIQSAKQINFLLGSLKKPENYNYEFKDKR